jgi:hypothetical protein
MKAARWRTEAFGLAVEGDFPAPGLDDGSPAASRARPATVELGEREEIDTRWDGAGAECVFKWAGRGPGLGMAIDRSDEAGFRIRMGRFGTFEVSSDGRRVNCAPPAMAAWRWQRYLIGQALPMASLLQGLEVFHASCVAIDGKALAFTGPSTAGKTSIAAELMLTGARFLCDDALAVEPHNGTVTAHPGPPLANLRHATGRMLGRVERRRLGQPLGRDRESTRIAVAATCGPNPLHAIYFLEYRKAARKVTVEPMGEPGGRKLLTSSFNLIMLDRGRLFRQLDVCARIAGCAALYLVLVPPDASARELGRAVARHAWEAS